MAAMGSNAGGSAGLLADAIRTEPTSETLSSPSSHPGQWGRWHALLRVYHVWCMFIGLLMALALELQVCIAIFTEFFSAAWTWSDESPVFAMAASAVVSVQFLQVATDLCSSAVCLMRDACREDSFLVTRALLLLTPLHQRLELPEATAAGALAELRRRTADVVVRAIIMILLDVVPILAMLWSRRPKDWCVCVAFMSLAVVVMAWLWETFDDLRGKWQHRHMLFGEWPQEAASILSVGASSTCPVAPTVHPDPERVGEGQQISGAHGLHFINRAIALRQCLWPYVVVLIIAAAMWITDPILRLLLVWCTCLAPIRSRSVLRVELSTEEERNTLCDSMDNHFRILQPCGGACWSLPAGAQLVGDGIFSDGETQKQIRRLPTGTVLAFHERTLGPRTAYLETFCGASPDQLVDNARVIMFFGIAGACAFFASAWFSAAFFCMAGTLVYASPAICLFVAPPRLAKWCHVAVSVTLSVFCLLAVTLAPSRGSVTLVWVPIMCFSTHLLLHRRPQRMQVLTILFTACFSLVVAIFFLLSFDATFKQPLHATTYDMSRNFTFREHGQRNPYVGGATSPACSLEFPTSNRSRPMRLVDFALLSKVVYEPDLSLQKMLSDWMQEWKLVKEQRRELGCKDEKVCNVHDWASFFVFDGHEGTGLEDTTIVTIRGTKTQLEMMFDLNLWALQIFGMPRLTSHFPMAGEVFNAFWFSPTVGKAWFRGKRARYRSVFDYMKNRTEAEPHRRYYLTGHSLGGGLAQLLTAELGTVQAITFSAPGSMETARLLGLDPGVLQGLSVNVMPENDPVCSFAGAQAGVRLPIKCRQSGPNCHRIFNTVCELFRECGDAMRRTWPCDFCRPEARRQSPVCRTQFAGSSRSTSPLREEVDREDEFWEEEDGHGPELP